MKKILLALCLSLACISAFATPKTIQKLSSPDGRIILTVCTEKGISYSLECDGVSLLDDSSISMTLENGTIFGSERGKPSKVKRSSIDRLDQASIFKKSAIRDCCNTLTLTYKNFDIEFRVYDDAIAYRFVSKVKSAFKVTSEKARFNFAKPWPSYIGYVCQHDDTLEGQFLIHSRIFTFVTT